MKLAFVYIDEHKALKNISIPLISAFNYDYENSTLIITHNETYISDYYDNILINVIIGPNGSGKTTILDFIEDALGKHEGAGFLIWANDNLSKFYIQELNYKFKHEMVSIPVEIGFYKLDEMDFQNFEIIKVNNINDYVFDKKNKSRKVIDLSAKARNRSKQSKSRQLDSILKYINSDLSKKKYEKTRYKVNFGGWTPALKNWIKYSFVTCMRKEYYIIEEFMNSHFFTRLTDSEKDFISKSLDGVEELTEVPAAYSGFLEFLGELSLFVIERAIEIDEHFEFIEKRESRFSSYFYKFESQENYPLREDYQLQYVEEKGLFSIYLKNVLHIFKYNCMVHNLHAELSSIICCLLVEIISDGEWRGRESIRTILSFLENGPDLRGIPREQITTELNKVNELLDSILEDYDLFVDKLITVFKGTNALSNFENIDSVVGYIDLERLRYDVINGNCDSHRALQELRYSGRYKGVEKYSLANSDDIILFSENIKKIPPYLRKSIDLGWEGLSSGELAKVSLFSVIYDKFLSLKEHGHFIWQKNKNLDSAKLYSLQDRRLLIVIDEADLYLHPEWQRTFVDELLNLINDLKLSEHVQCILTTHSPLIIGDFLPEDIVSLSISNGKTMTVNSTGFGTQIADFYLSGMHLESTYGEHARKKLQTLLDKVCCEAALSKEERQLASKVSNKFLRRTLLSD